MSPSTLRPWRQPLTQNLVEAGIGRFDFEAATIPTYSGLFGRLGRRARLGRRGRWLRCYRLWSGLRGGLLLCAGLVDCGVLVGAGRLVFCLGLQARPKARGRKGEPFENQFLRKIFYVACARALVGDSSSFAVAPSLVGLQTAAGLRSRMSSCCFPAQLHVASDVNEFIKRRLIVLADCDLGSAYPRAHWSLHRYTASSPVSRKSPAGWNWESPACNLPFWFWLQAYPMLGQPWRRPSEIIFRCPLRGLLAIEKRVLVAGDARRFAGCHSLVELDKRIAQLKSVSRSCQRIWSALR